MKPRAALVVEGGAMRAVFAAGVLRGLVDTEPFPFDFCLGGSSGALVAAFALLGRPELALEAFTGWAATSDFVSFARFARGGNLLDLEALAGQVTRSLDLPRPWVWRAPLHVCITDVASGQPRYLEAREDNLVDLLRATTAMPWLYRGFPLVDGRRSTDGGASDAIPVARALAWGAARVVVVRSRPRDYVKRDTWGHRLVRWKLREHAALREVMSARAERFQTVVRLMRSPPPDVEILEICPPRDFAMGRFGRDPAVLRAGYQAGLEAARQALVQGPIV